MKGIVASELVIATSIYIIGIIFFIQIISHNLVSFSKDVEQKTKKNIAEDISKILFESKGIPENWEYEEDIDDIKQLGLCKNVTSICIISNEKLNSFASLDPENAKNLLNLKGYNFRVLIKDINNNTIFGYNSSTISGLVGISQKEVLNESLAKLNTFVQVW
jgi:hypothetical protein